MVGMQAQWTARSAAFSCLNLKPCQHARKIAPDEFHSRRVVARCFEPQRVLAIKREGRGLDIARAAGADGNATVSESQAESEAQRRWKPLLGLVVMCSLAMLMASPALAASTSSFSPTNALKGVLTFVLHLDDHLAQIIARHGRSTYAILFAIVFAETGLVVTPFLPGDSLLFAAGTFAALGHLSLAGLMATFITSAILGDALNYQVGKMFGTRVKEGNLRLVRKEYIDKTEKFYEKHGAQTVVLARFIPIVRTFAPFVAGVGAMSYKRFSLYNVGGAVLWSVIFVGAGFLLGNIPAVKHNFSIVVFAIVGISVLPVLYELWAAKRKGGEPSPPGPGGSQGLPEEGAP